MNLPLLRPLGQIETAMAGLHEQAGTTQTSSLLSLDGLLDAALLRSAAAQLWQRHPLLQATIEEQAGGLYYTRNARLDELPVRHLALSDPSAALAQLEQELNCPLDPSRGLWKLALLSAPGQQHHLLLTCHHAIVDALSLTLLLGELLQF
jgi:nonribosomal peptide synthetase CepB